MTFYHTECGIFANVDKPYRLTKDLELHIIELPKLKKMIKENKEVKMAKEELDRINQDAREAWLAEKRLEYIRDLHSSEDYGREEGKKEGIKEGIKRGSKEKSKSIAKKLFEMGMKEQEILEITELSKQELDEIKK